MANPNMYCLRVNQIDSKSLDHELDAIIESKVNDLQVEALKPLTGDLVAIIKAYIWLHSVGNNGISIGQSLLRLRYYDSSGHTIQESLNRVQSVAIVLTQIVLPWIRQRVNNNNTIGHHMDLMNNIYKTFDFINGLIFLYYGKYTTLWERVVRLSVGLQSNHQNWSNNELYLEIMNRELLWHTFAQLLSSILPFINFYRLKNSCLKMTRSVVKRSHATIESNVSLRQTSHLHNCLICNEWPINAHEIGCRHVFCYYCLMSNYLSDQINGFTCSECLYSIKSMDVIKRVHFSYFVN